jgi:hypothetical protein
MSTVLHILQRQRKRYHGAVGLGFSVSSFQFLQVSRFSAGPFHCIYTLFIRIDRIRFFPGTYSRRLQQLDQYDGRVHPYIVATEPFADADLKF